MPSEPSPPRGNNLIGKTDGSTGWVNSDLTGTIAKPLNPLLAPLGNYGGPTQTWPCCPAAPPSAADQADYPGTDFRHHRPARFPADSPTPTSAPSSPDPSGGQHHRRRRRLPFGDLSLREAVDLADALAGIQSDYLRRQRVRHAQTIALTGPSSSSATQAGTEAITGPGRLC